MQTVSFSSPRRCFHLATWQLPRWQRIHPTRRAETIERIKTCCYGAGCSLCQERMAAKLRMKSPLLERKKVSSPPQPTFHRCAVFTEAGRRPPLATKAKNNDKVSIVLQLIRLFKPHSFHGGFHCLVWVWAFPSFQAIFPPSLLQSFFLPIFPWK